MKYKKGEIVSFAHKLYKVKNYRKNSLHEYDLESVKLDKNGMAEICFGIPEGFLTKK